MLGELHFTFVLQWQHTCKCVNEYACVCVCVYVCVCVFCVCAHTCVRVCSILLCMTSKVQCAFHQQYRDENDAMFCTEISQSAHGVMSHYEVIVRVWGSVSGVLLQLLQYLFLYTYVYTHTCLHASTQACHTVCVMYVWGRCMPLHACVRACVCVCAHVHMHVCVCVCVHVRVCVCVYLPVRSVHALFSVCGLIWRRKINRHETNCQTYPAIVCEQDCSCLYTLSVPKSPCRL